MAEDVAQTRGAGKKWLFISIMLISILAGGSTAALYFLGFFSSSTEAAVPKTAGGINEVLPLESLVVNLADEGEIHYARVGISIGVFNPSPGIPVLDESLIIPKLKDALLTVLSKRTSAELVAPKTKETLRKEILDLVNGVLQDSQAEVQEVYFTEFIVQ